jgi:hypothetical protein
VSPPFGGMEHYFHMLRGLDALLINLRCLPPAVSMVQAPRHAAEITAAVGEGFISTGRQVGVSV